MRCSCPPRVSTPSDPIPSPPCELKRLGREARCAGVLSFITSLSRGMSKGAVCCERQVCGGTRPQEGGIAGRQTGNPLSSRSLGVKVKSQHVYSSGAHACSSPEYTCEAREGEEQGAGT